jgi:hypothetical protein
VVEEAPLRVHRGVAIRGKEENMNVHVPRFAASKNKLLQVVQLQILMEHEKLFQGRRSAPAVLAVRTRSIREGE